MNMKYENPLDIPFTNEDIILKFKEMKPAAAFYTIENLKKIFSFIDLTSLNITDTEERIAALCRKVIDFNVQYADIPQVAALCVFPNFVEKASLMLDNTNVNIASVSACFPTGFTFQIVKEAETDIALGKGADEIDIVMPLNLYFEKKYKNIFKELKSHKRRVGDKHLKVILETGVLEENSRIWKASMLAMNAGADFIKTSTGKNGKGASPEAVMIMTQAIKYYYKQTKRKVGIKPAGGIATVDDALQYYAIVHYVLGDEWLTPEFFRIGASRLANNLLSEIVHFGKEKKETIKYF